MTTQVNVEAVQKELLKLTAAVTLVDSADPDEFFIDGSVVKSGLCFIMQSAIEKIDAEISGSKEGQPWET